MTDKKRYNTNTPYWHGLRHGSDEPKSEGFFGRVPIPGSNSVATEYSVDVDINGKPVQIPTIVPTLSAQELASVLKAAGPQGGDLPEAVIGKAVDHARARMGAGQSPFWRMPEKQVSVPQQGIVEALGSNLVDNVPLYVEALRRKGSAQ